MYKNVSYCSTLAMLYKRDKMLQTCWFMLIVLKVFFFTNSVCSTFDIQYMRNIKIVFIDIFIYLFS